MGHSIAETFAKEGAQVTDMAVKLVKGSFKLYRIDQFGCARCLYGGNTEPKNSIIAYSCKQRRYTNRKQVPESTEEDWENVMVLMPKAV